MKKNELKRPKGSQSAKRVGRGGKRGKTSGSGMKGQKSRAGNSTRPEMRDIIKKLPKRRGYGVNRARTVVPRTPIQAVNLDQLEAHFEAGSTVSPKTILEASLARRVSGKLPQVKVLARGTLSKKLSLSGVAVSAAAKAAVEKAGGSIV